MKSTNDDSLYKKIDEFFLHINNYNFNDRPGQSTMALSVGETIEEKQLALFQAGVGIGKTFAYLIPILLGIQNGNCQKIVISTSSINLQEQLKKDLEIISNILDIHVDSYVIKGKNNYVCLKSLKDYVNFKGINEEKSTYLIDMAKSCSDKVDYIDILGRDWQKVNAVSCKPDVCSLSGTCKYQLERKAIGKIAKGIIITNHDMLIEDEKRPQNKKIFTNIDTIVYDEAHMLYDKIIEHYKNIITTKNLDIIFSSFEKELGILNSITTEVKNQINCVFASIKKRAVNFFNRTSEEERPTEKMKLGFSKDENFYTTVREALNALNSLIYGVLKKYENYMMEEKDTNLLQSYKYIIKMSEVFLDILRKEKSKNIYWVNLEETSAKNMNKNIYFELNYIDKNIDKFIVSLLQKEASIIMTSASLTFEENYEYLSNLYGLSKILGKSIYKEFPQKSPYNYEENSIVYYPKNSINPNNNSEEYINYLVDNINSLITLTNGRTLILFTSKKIMNETYKKVINTDHNFNIILQEENQSDAKIKQTFEEDETSVLFATGTFWEGIDIKGLSLSQIIITKLPFAVVNPILEYRGEKYKTAEEKIKEVYMPDMKIKLIQGIGRLIRSYDDTGIVSILDSRYRDEIINSNILISNNITTDIVELEEFSQNKITNRPRK